MICFHLTRSMNDWLWRAISHYIAGSFASYSFFLLRFKPLMVWTCINYTLPELNNFDEFSNSAKKKKEKQIVKMMAPAHEGVGLRVGWRYDISNNDISASHS